MSTEPDSRWPRAFWIAHRGAGLLAPENTLAAFRVGAVHGYRAFECDVKLSADDVPFLLHDATLDRTTSGHGVAGTHVWSELARLDAGGWHSRAYAGEPPPSLANLANYVLANGFDLDLEIKPTPGLELKTGEVVGRQVLELWRGAKAWPLLSSFRPEALLGARESAPQVPRALLLNTWWNGWFEMAASLGCQGIVANFNILGADVVTRMHEAGMFALAYTVNDPAPADWLRAIGIDGIITDAVDRFSPGG